MIFYMVEMFSKDFFRVRSWGTPLGVCELWIVGAKSFIREGSPKVGVPENPVISRGPVTSVIGGLLWTP